MKEISKCKYCDQVFDINKKVFANHVRWCDKNITNGDKGASNISKGAKVRKLKAKGLLLDFDVNCKLCNKIYSVREYEKEFPKRKEYFCSRSCANSRGQRSEETKEKIAQSLKTSLIAQNQRITLKKERLPKKCAVCSSFFTVRNEKQKSCSRACGKKARYIGKEFDDRSFYRRLCSFKFNLADYNKEFDFDLIRVHGWYKAKNHGNNLGGVSRDHMVSIDFGFKNKIDPKILSHPANCRLVRQNDNASKGMKSSLTLEELIIKINVWNLTYGVL